MNKHHPGWLLLLWPLSAAAEPEFAREWPLHLAEADAGAYRIELETSVYQAAYWPDWRDVQVLDSNGQPVPSAVTPAPATLTTTTETIALAWFALPAETHAAADLDVLVQRDGDGQVIAIRGTGASTRTAADPAWLVDTAAHAGKVRALHVDWAEPEASVDVGLRLEASDDLRHWQVLDNDVRLVQLHNQDTVLRSNRIALATAQRYLRLTPLQRSGAPLLHALRGEVVSTPANEDWRWLELHADAESEAGGFDYHTHGRFPVQRLDVRMPAGSTATWTVLTRDAPSVNGKTNGKDQRVHWLRRVSDWNAWNLGTEDARRSPPLKLAYRVSDQHWRLQPTARSALSSAPVLRLGWLPGSVVFIAAGAPPYRLVAGSARTEAGHATLEPMLDTLRKERRDWQPATATLGPSRERAGEAAYRPAPQPRDWSTWMLWAVLVAGAALVTQFALRLIRSPPAEPPPDA